MYLLTTLLCYLGYFHTVSAQISKGSFRLVTPDPICVQCDYATVRWDGGMTPYVLSVSGKHNSYKLTGVGTTSTSQMKWHVNFPTGTQLWFQLVDGNATDIYTNVVTVAPSSDASCVNVTNTVVTDPSDTPSLLPSPSSTSMSTASSGTNSYWNRNPSSRVSTGSIAGGIAGGVAVLLLLVLLVLWRRRRARRARSTPGAKATLDLSADSNGTVVEPFIPAAAVSQNSLRMGDQPVSTKIRSIPSASSSGTQIGSSSNGAPSAGVTPSSSSQPIHELARAASNPNTPAKRRTRREPESVGPVQESDAGVRSMGGVHQEQPATLPPAYDSTWRE